MNRLSQRFETFEREIVGLDASDGASFLVELLLLLKNLKQCECNENEQNET